MELYSNKENNILKFKINSEGIDTNKIEPRLILTTNENKNYFLIGKVENDICKFNIPQLNLYQNGDSGRIKFEIISEDLYFPVWEDDFEIKTKHNLTLEKMIFDVQQETKPKARISMVSPEIETPKIEEQVKMMNDDKISFMKSITEPEKKVKKEIVKEEVETNVNTEKLKIKKFDSF